jgi:hypothetical protein
MGQALGGWNVDSMDNDVRGPDQCEIDQASLESRNNMLSHSEFQSQV